MAGTLKVDSINADSNLALKIANTAVAFIDATGLRPVAGNLNLDATATSKLYLPSANTVAIQTAGVTAVTVDSSQNATFAGKVTSAGALTLASNGTTTAVTIDTSQNVQIATTTRSNDEKFTVFQSGSAMGISVRTTGGPALGNYESADNSRASYWTFGRDNASTGNFVFANNGTQRVAIDTSGNLLVGTTSPYNNAKFSVNQPTGGQIAAYFYNTGSSVGTSVVQIAKADNNSTTSQAFVQFLMNTGATGSGQINANGANAAAFGVYSDRRLKENITELPSQLANIMALRTVEFDYIESEGGGHQIGFIAQEVQQVYPDLVGERADGMLTLTDLNKNDARLIKCIQEQQALITAQAATITALTARIVALETT